LSAGENPNAKKLNSRPKNPEQRGGVEEEVRGEAGVVVGVRTARGLWDGEMVTCHLSVVLATGSKERRKGRGGRKEVRFVLGEENVFWNGGRAEAARRGGR